MLEKQVILLKGEDRTSELFSILNVGKHYLVKFINSSKEYKYKSEEVKILTNPKTVNIKNKVFYYYGILQNDIYKIIEFEDYYRVFYSAVDKHGKNINELWIKSYVNIENSVRELDLKNSLVHYWRELSQYIKIKDNESLLKRHFDRLTYFKEECVLNTYINRYEIKNNKLEKDKIIFPFKYNLSQKKAVENALSNNISVIEGPPGTGKTQTILNIIANLIMQNKTVAVVSSNNEAIKNVKEKLAKYDYDFMVACLGNSINQKHFFENIPKINIPEISTDNNENNIFTRIVSLNKDINNLLKINNKLANLKQELLAYETEKEHFIKFYEHKNVTEIRKLSFYKQSSDKILSFMAEYLIAENRNKVSSLTNKIKLFIKYGFYNFKLLNDSEIDLVLNLQKRYYIEKTNQLQKDIEGLQLSLKSKCFDNLLKEHESLSNELFKQKISNKYKGKNKRKYNYINYKRKMNDFASDFPVIISTTYSILNSKRKDYLFDYIIIDESSQVDLLTGVLAFASAENAVIVGDTKQLPQIINKNIKSKLEIQCPETDFDYFKHNILSSIINIYKDKLPRVILKEHYRCHPKIINFCNKKYYNGELIPFTSSKDNNALHLYKTVEGNHTRTVTRGNDKGKYNQREIDVIVEEVLKNPNTYDRDKSIGVVTPYRKQANKVQEATPEYIDCDTVHKYQGREKSVMVMTSVLDNKVSSKKSLKFADNPNLVNVAVSRAKEKFVLVTDKTFFNNNGTELRDLINYMEYNTLDKNIINSKIVSIFDLLYKDFSKKLLPLRNKMVSISKFKSENIMATLLSEILQESDYCSYVFRHSVLLKNIFKSLDLLSDEEKKYVKNNSSVDFIIYNKFNNMPVLAIEVDGFEYHENNPAQQERDNKKDSIFKKYELPLLRLATNGSGEREKFKDFFYSIAKK
ncbi:AAA family ATPase [Clostridium sp. 'deep sea']|uniref:AAA domain-containing protein n=1 Tax=Clostridium sp. 'deep sea' TaxID=2779445 RepID=UPI0018963FB7|nr:AAA domain-containing protein [Clostridium sp. 'deep sea']QOR35070.1 AAA family ATPase [Clostridium sp. 'deep sea']